MNKTELVNAVAEQTLLTKRESEAAITALTDTITAQLQKGESVVLVGFGTFQIKDREARTGRRRHRLNAELLSAVSGNRNVIGFAVEILRVFPA